MMKCAFFLGHGSFNIHKQYEMKRNEWVERSDGERSRETDITYIQFSVQSKMMNVARIIDKQEQSSKIGISTNSRVTAAVVVLA